MITVGITGGIGSGKTTISKVFELLKIPVFYADNEAAHASRFDERIVTKLQERYGSEIYSRPGILNKAKLASVIFSNPGEKEFVNGLIHPVVRERFLIWVKNQTTKYVIEEAAILIETGIHTQLDKIILVTCPEELRIKRIMNRDGKTMNEIKAVIANQLSDEEKRKYCDYEIKNDGSELVIPQILKIHEELLKARR